MSTRPYEGGAASLRPMCQEKPFSRWVLVAQASVVIPMLRRWFMVAILTVFFVVISAGAPSAGGAPERLVCGVAPGALDCSAMLPGAVRFEPFAGSPYQTGFNKDNKPIGWVALSTDVVNIKAYSGKPLVTLVGVNTDGVFAGVQVIYHSEPILLVGIPESAMENFVGHYSGTSVSSRVVVGKSDGDGVKSIDAISGATVTALALNQTVLAVGRRLAMDVGVLARDRAVGGHFVERSVPLTWAEMEAEGVFGRLYVSEEKMGRTSGGSDHGQFMNLWFTIADAPQIGRALFGDNDYKWLRDRQREGEHLVVVLGVGSSSFKGSGFVRGGIFDRIRLEQGLRQLIFRDTDYRNVPVVRAVGAPDFKEGAVFFSRDGKLRPGEPFDLVFMGSRYDGKGGFSREFHSFSATHRLPDSLYKRRPTNEFLQGENIYGQAWRNRGPRAWLLVGFLMTVMGLFLRKNWLTAHMKRLSLIHGGVMVISVLVLGFMFKAQPSITQLLTLLDGALNGFRLELYLSEPTIFVSWIGIALVTLVWGRGVFCGWLCPFGALTELLFRLGRWLRLPKLELPPKIHRRARLLRYLVLVGLVGSFLYSAELGERLAEVEPFKTTFLVAPWTRHWTFVGWWLLLILLSLAWFRPFCRYLCPLGAGLGLASTWAPLVPPRRIACKNCQVCRRGCELKAFRPDGSIDLRECLSCLECEVHYHDDTVCPPLVALRSLMRAAEDDCDSIRVSQVIRLHEKKKEWT